MKRVFVALILLGITGICSAAMLNNPETFDSYADGTVLWDSGPVDGWEGWGSGSGDGGWGGGNDWNYTIGSGDSAAVAVYVPESMNLWGYSLLFNHGTNIISLPGSLGFPLTLQFDVISIEGSGVAKIEYYDAAGTRLAVDAWDPVDLSALGHFAFAGNLPVGTVTVTPVVGVTGVDAVGVFDNIQLGFGPGAISGGYVYTDNGDGTCTITDYDGPGGDVIIPDTLAGLTVTAIGDYAFSYYDEGNTITGVTISDSVTSIGSYAFENCWDLVDVTIGSGVNSIGDRVFSNCTALTAITVDENNNAFSSTEGVLFDKNQTVLIKHPSSKSGNYIIPNSVTVINDWAFYNCDGLTDISIPDSVTSIGNSAFRYSSALNSVTIGSGLTSIGDQVFDSCSALTAITVDENNNAFSSIEGVLFDKNQTVLIKHPLSKSGDYLIPSSVTVINNRAFYDCDGLTDISMPDSVMSIGDRAFYDCDGLTDVSIPDSVMSIGGSAFSYCNALTDVTIGNGVTSIGGAAFHGSSLTNVIMGSSVTSIGNWAFGRSDLTTISIPDSVTSIGDDAFSNCPFMTCISIGRGLTSIGDWAFDYCVGLNSLYFKGDAPGLGSSVFDDVSGMVYYIPGTSGWRATYGGLTTAAWALSIADVDANGDVNLWDFATFAAAWGAVDGVDAEYDPLCDISDPVDGVIDIADLDEFTFNWLITPCE